MDDTLTSPRVLHRTGGFLRIASGAAVLLAVFTASTTAQTIAEPEGLTVREISVSTGYGAVQLPPVTLGGYLPNDMLHADLITVGSAAIDWRRVTTRTRYRFDLFGTYTARAKYSQLSAPGVDLTFGLSQAIGRRWRVGAGGASALASSDQMVFQPGRARRLSEDAASVEELAGALALTPGRPDASQPPLFVPVNQSAAWWDAEGARIWVSTARVDATYAHSVRLATRFRGSYATVRQLSTRHDPEGAPVRVDTAARSAGVSIRYERSERTTVLTDVDWSRTAGVSADEAVSGTIGYAWSGRRWFTLSTAGVAFRPSGSQAAGMAADASSMLIPVYSAAIGHKTRNQTLLFQYSRIAHDEYGHGGVTVSTGFTSSVQSLVGSWSWWTPRGGWLVRSDISLVRRPGNFSNIYTWIATTGLGRQLRRDVRVMAEVLIDRHGSRGFEGYHLIRESARLALVWSPRRRPRESSGLQ